MSIFAAAKLDAIKKNGKLSFYKLIVDEECPFDEFYEEVCKDARTKKDMKHIVSLMDYMAETDIIMPKEKFNSIIEGDKVIGYEFKKNALRVYCTKLNPNVLVVIGGYKKNQEKDIKKFKRLLIEAHEQLPDYI